jgi:hypothetical protein
MATLTYNGHIPTESSRPILDGIERLMQPLPFAVGESVEYIDKPVYEIVEVLEQIFKPVFKVEHKVESIESVVHKPVYKSLDTIIEVKRPVFKVVDEEHSIPGFLLPVPAPSASVPLWAWIYMALSSSAIIADLILTRLHIIH